MISTVTSKYQPNYKPLTKAAPTFAGDKDILVIDECNCAICTGPINEPIKEALGKRIYEYTIHSAVGGKEGLEKVQQIQPFLTITAYNMRQWSPDGVELIKALKKLGTKVIVVTSNWYQYGIESIKAGVKNCEEEAGADKYIYEYDYIFEGVKNPIKRAFYEKFYSADKVFKKSIEAIINDTPIPKYPFQIEKKDLLSKFIAIFWPNSNKETSK